MQKFENESALLECPKGNTSIQRWIKHSDERGNRDMNPVPKSSLEGPKYHIDSTQIADGGIYKCYEGRALLMTIDLEVYGELLFYFHLSENCSMSKKKK